MIRLFRDTLQKTRLNTMHIGLSAFVLTWLFILAAQLITSAAVPSDPTLSVPSSGATDIPINPTFTASTYSGSPAHQDTDWQIVETSDCAAGTIVWSSLADGNNLESINVNSLEGTFANTLSGYDALSYNTTYYACVRYRNADGTTAWVSNSFTTEDLGDWTSYEDISVTETSGSTLSSYQTRIEFDSTSLTFSDTESDGADLRFTDSTATYGLPYYIADWDTSGQTGVVWVRIPSLSASSSTGIRVYYDDTPDQNVPTTAGDAVFLDFTDENNYEDWSTGYSNSAYNTFTANGDWLHVEDNSGSATRDAGKTLSTAIQAETNFTLETRMKAEDVSGVADNVIFLVYDGNSNHRFNQLWIPYYTAQSKFGYHEGGSNKSFTAANFSFGTTFEISQVVDGASNQVDYLIYDTNRTLLDSQVNEGLAKGSPTSADILRIATGGNTSHKSNAYFDFIAFREYSTSEPTYVFGSISLLDAIAQDADSNGQIDEILVSFDRDVDSGTVTTSDFSVSGYTINSVSVSSDEVTLGVTEKSFTSSTLNISSSISGTDGTIISSGSTTLVSHMCPGLAYLSNGTITINSATTFDTSSYSSASDTLDCTGLDLLVTNSSTLTLEGDTSNGYIPHLKADNIQIDSGSSISADSEGCTGSNTGTYEGFAPNGSNVCTQGADGSGEGASGTISAGGGAYGGNGGAGSGSSYPGGTAFEEVDSSPTFGASGGSSNKIGGTGGGVIQLTVSDTLTHNGSMSTTGGVGATGSGSGGGGAGGSIYIDTATMAGSTGTFDVSGGAGGNGTTTDGGGGGGGRVYVEYDSSSFTFDSGDFTLSGGSGPGGGADGSSGSAFVKNTSGSYANIYGSLYVSEGTKTFTDAITIDSNTNITCHSSVVDGQLTAAGLTLQGTTDCSDASSLNSLTFASTTTTFDLTSATITMGADGSTLEFDMAASTSSAWSNSTITGSDEGDFVIDDAASITLSGTTAVNSSVNWSALTSLTVNSGTSINAAELGCQPIAAGSSDGAGPNGSNVCSQSTAGAGGGASGAGGAGHGGSGGDGNSGTNGGASYGTSSNPTLFGSSGGSAAANAGGGAGGGLVKITTSGTLTHNGSINVDGGDGINGTGSGGGGAGGSINLNVGTFAGSTGSFSLLGGDGGNGASSDGGGGSGGRFYINYTTDSSSYLSGLSAATIAAGGAGPGAATTGDSGTLHTSNGNDAPTVDSTTIGLTSGGSDSSINLSDNGTTTVYVHGEISDTNGCTDVETDGSVTAVFYRTNVSGGTSCTADNNDCYSLSCTLSNCSGGGDPTFDYECTANINYFADATDVGSTYAGTDWTASVTAEDAASDSGSNTDTAEMNSLTAINLPGSSINYGSLSLDQESAQQSITITNTGNRDIDIDVSSENLSCTSGTIDASYLHISGTDGFSYASGAALSTSATEHELNLAARTDDGSESQSTLYIKLKLPETGVGGVCDGDLTIDAKVDD